MTVRKFIDRRKKLTNGDRIRKMSDKELAVFLRNIGFSYENGFPDVDKPDNETKKIFRWLKSVI